MNAQTVNVVFSSVSPVATRTVSLPKGLARYATDVSTYAASDSEADITAFALSLTHSALLDAIAEEKIAGWLAEILSAGKAS